MLEEAFDSAATAGVGFLVTAVVLVATSILQKNDGGKGLLQTTWRDALLIGLAQMFAPFPGVSRSGLTIATALALGLSRTWAVEFSLLIAVPTISGAVVFMLKDMLEGDVAHTLTPDRIAQTVAATIVAGLVGYAAISWLVKVVRSGHLWYFSVYLVVLAIAVLSAVAMRGPEGGAANARGAEPGTNPLERAARLDLGGTRPDGPAPADPRPLARPLADGPRPGHSRPRPARTRRGGLRQRRHGLLLG
jgi:undecaprenyl-diphosphatase